MPVRQTGRKYFYYLSSEQLMANNLHGDLASLSARQTTSGLGHRVAMVTVCCRGHACYLHVARCRPRLMNWHNNIVSVHVCPVQISHEAFYFKMALKHLQLHNAMECLNIQ